MENLNIKTWYIDTYPTDEMGEDINPEINFENIFEILDKGDIYESIGVADSIIRERIFEKLSKISGILYEEIYNKWLLS
jgi:hypothetical protein